MDDQKQSMVLRSAIQAVNQLKNGGFGSGRSLGYSCCSQTIQSAVLAETRSRAYADLCAKAFLSALVEVST